MNNEFKKSKNGKFTVYTLESATSGGTSAGSVASVSMPMGGVRKRGDNLIAQEDNKTVEPPKPRNFVAKNAKMGGAGQHKDKKKAAKQGDVKHKKPLAEDHEIQMAGSELQSIAKNAVQLLGLIKHYSEQEGLDAWQQSKITKAADYLNSVLQSISGEQTSLENMSRAAKGNEKYGKDGMKALAKAGREGASDEKLDAIRDKHDHYNEEWSQKYKSSINCSHPKGFSQKAHCAGKKKHNESMEMESVCPDCGMCQTHGNVKEGLRNPKDNPCWKGYKPVGTKKKGGRTVPNCVPKEGVAESAEDRTSYQVAKVLADKGIKYDPAHEADLIKAIGMVLVKELNMSPKEARHLISYDEDFLSDTMSELSNMKNAGGDEYMESLAQKLAEKIPANAPVDVWVKDFQKADPNKYRQFKNKTPEKKAQMAVAASYAAKNPNKKK